MSIIITFFYLSLAMIVGMLSFKLMSLRKLNLSVIEAVERELYRNLYARVSETTKVLRQRYYVPLRALSRALFFYGAHRVLHAALIVGNKIKARHSKWYNMVKGRGVIRQKGSVSFFLQNVTDYKKTMTTK